MTLRTSSRSRITLTRRSAVPLLVTLALAAGVSACGSGADPEPSDTAEPSASDTAPAELKPVSIRTDFTIGGKDVPYFQAKAMGFYEDAGLDVTIAAGKGGSSTLQLVASGDETFGQADGPAVVSSIASGLPIRTVASWIDETVNDIYSYCDTGIKEPADLVGKTVAMSAGNAAYTAGFEILLKENGIDPADVTSIQVENASIAAAVASGQADAAYGSVTGSSLAFVLATEENNEGEACSMALSDYNVDAIGYGVSVHEDTIKNDPEMIRAFVAATVKGWESALEDPTAGLDLMAEQFPSGDPEYWERGWEVVKDYIWAEDAPEGENIAIVPDHAMQVTVDLVGTYTELPSQDASDYYTDEFYTD